MALFQHESCIKVKSKLISCPLSPQMHDACVHQGWMKTTWCTAPRGPTRSFPRRCARLATWAMMGGRQTCGQQAFVFGPSSSAPCPSIMRTGGAIPGVVDDRSGPVPFRFQSWGPVSHKRPDNWILLSYALLIYRGSFLALLS